MRPAIDSPGVVSNTEDVERFDKGIHPPGPTKFEVQEKQRIFKNDVMKYMDEVKNDILDDSYMTIKDRILNRFGIDGVKVFEKFGDASEDDEITLESDPDWTDEPFDDTMPPIDGEIYSDVNGECAECGKLSEELMAKYTKQIQVIDDVTNPELDPISERILEECDGYRVSDKLVKKTIIEFMPQYKLDDIPVELLVAVKRKFLFDGILNGWLIDDNFMIDDVEQRILEEGVIQ